MTLPSVPFPLSSAVVLASAHGLADAHDHPLPTLALSYAPLPLLATLLPRLHPLLLPTLSLLASVLHFADDLGGKGASAAVHAAWLACHAAGGGQGRGGGGDLLAWLSFTAFYCGVHAPRRWGEWRERRGREAALGAAGGGVAALVRGRRDLALTPWTQALVVCHVWLAGSC